MNKKPTVKEFFIFNRLGNCIYHLDLQDNSSSNKAFKMVTDKKLEHRYKLIYGLLFSMRSFVKKFSSNKETETFKNFSTSQYKLHIVEFLNGLRFVILSSPTSSDYGGFIKELFKNYYVTIISSNLFTDKDAYINNSLFTELTLRYLREITL